MYVIKQVPEDFVVVELIDLPQGEGEFAYYRLSKRLLGTEDAVQELCAALGVRRKDVGYAGNKDVRALTTQWISVRAKKVGALHRGGWSIEFERFGPRPISLGMNRGNHFEVVVRDVEGAPQIVERFVNYFGEQRFGSQNVLVGRALVRGQFAEAAQLLVAGGQLATAADPIRELRSLPLKVLKLFVHAYQSWMWNETVCALVDRGVVVDEVPIVGFGYDAEECAFADVIENILAREGLSPRDFVIRSLPGLSSEGGMRPLFAVASNVSVKQMDSKAVRFVFDLPKGAYATEFLRQSILRVHAPVFVEGA